MVLADKLYDWLEHARSDAADHVLAAGLDHAEEAYRQRITVILLKRCTEASLGGLIGALDQMPLEVQTRILHETARKPGGIAAAMRSTSVRARLNAMTTLERVPTPRLSYLLPYALRDGAGAVRDAAVRAGRTISETFLDRAVPPADAEGGQPRREYDVERGQLVQAMREVARTYDRHFRLELLEVCLWFADNLEAELWALLNNPRSNSGRAVQDHLQLWNGPRLAGFLLQCLKHSEWRRPAQLLLRNWQRLDAVTALLSRTAMLDDEEIRRGLAGVNQPRWFDECGSDLGRLPEEVRRHAPRWLAAVGIVAEQKVRTLSDWLRTPNEALRRAAVYALAGLDLPQARRALRSCAGGKTPIGQFARWVLAAPATGPATARIRAVGGVLQPGAAAPSEPFRELWRALRAASGELQAALLRLLQEHADLAERPLRTALAAADPRERLLALQVVGTHEHAARFARELEVLRSDSISAIRGLAQTILGTVSATRGAAGGAAGDAPPAAARLTALEARIRELKQAEGGALLANVPELGFGAGASRRKPGPKAAASTTSEALR